MKLHCDARMVEFVYRDIRQGARIYRGEFSSAMESRNSYGRIGARSLAKGNLNDALVWSFYFVVADAYIRELRDMADAKRQAFRELREARA